MRKLFVAILNAVFTAVVFAQGITTASLNGTVTDDRGQPLIGANIVAVHVPTGTAYGASTREDGRFNIAGVRVGGPYTVTASYVGYTDQKIEGITLSLGQDRRIDFKLTETVVAGQAVTVVAETDPILTASNTGTATNVTTAEIERLPTISRSITDFTRLTPQANGTGGSSATSIAGKNNRYNNFQVDGAVLNDAFGLDDSGLPTGQVNAQPISLDAIQEFNVNIAPFDVRSGSFAGGLINAVTRTGSNTFSGSAYFFGQNESFVGDLGENEFGEFEDFQTGFRLGGPLQKDKVFFFLNAEIRRRDQPDNGGLLGSGAANEFRLTPEEMQRIIDISRNRYGYDPGSFDPFTLETNDQKIFARLDFNLSEKHRLTLRHNFVDGSRDDGIDRGGNEFTLTTNQFKRDNTTNSTVLQLNSSLGNRMANEARIAFTAVRDKRTPPGDPFPQVRINLETDQGVEIGEVRFGYERFSQANALDQNVFEFTDNFHYFTGDHTITLGTHNEFVNFNNLFIQDFFGAYEFDSIEQFEAGTPTRYLFRKSLVPNDPKPRADWDYIQLGFYAQDEWKINPVLNLTFGLRVDIPLMPDEPLRNSNFEAAFPGFSTNEVPSGKLLLSPRLGFNYDLSGNRTTQLRGGAGLFAGLPPAVWLSNAYSNTGVDFAQVDLATFRGDNVPNFVPDPNNQPFVDQEQPPADIAMIDPDFKLPQILRANLAIDQKLQEGVVGTVEFLYGKNINEVFFKNLNIGNMGEPVGTTPDGRPDYGGVRTSDNFNSVILLTNTDEGYQATLTAGIKKLLGRGAAPELFGGLYYTFSRSKDINSGRSSRAISNWQFNETNDPNGETAATSDFEVRHRIVGEASYQFRYAEKFATTISLFYEGRSGNGFSYMYRDDVNGDGIRGNDLAFIPASRSDVSSQVSDEDWQKINTFIESDPALRDARGKIFPRNSARAPWQNRLDMRIAQKIPTLGLQNFEVTLDVLNLLSLLGFDDAGKIEFVNFDAVNLFNFRGFDNEGKPNITLRQGDTNEDGVADRDDVFRVSDLASRWQIQLGIRYSF